MPNHEQWEHRVLEWREGNHTDNPALNVKETIKQMERDRWQVASLSATGQFTCLILKRVKNV